MKLERKNLCYSIAIAGALLVFLITYFGGMLPSLYVAHAEDYNLESVINQQKTYLKLHSYEDCSYSSLSYTIDVPPEGNELLITSQLFQISVTLQDPLLISTLKDIRNEILSLSFDKTGLSSSKKEDFSQKLAVWKNALSTVWDQYKSRHMASDAPLQIKLLDSVFDVPEEQNTNPSSQQFHFINDSMLVLESKVCYGQNNYSNYLALSIEDRSLVITYLPAVTPQMNEITPIVLQSMPMLIAVTILIVLLFSVFYSRRIVHPITELEMYTRNASFQHTLSIPKACQNGKDEIAALAKAVNRLYTELHLQYKELEHKNQLLMEDNQRQEIFLKASSHQLKTPIAATLLLVDGMINKIGKYSDTDTYLPELKTHLLQIKKMTDDILSLRHCEADLSLDTITLDTIVSQCIQNHMVMIRARGHEIECTYEDLIPVTTDLSLLNKILDNLILNATIYAKEQSRIFVHGKRNQITIFNQGEIAPDLLPHIFEPFVTGNKDNNSHGLGLYIVNYYVKVLSASITIVNTSLPEHGTGVLTTLELPMVTKAVSMKQE